MTCLGISTMAVIMWVFMRKMYKNKKKNIAILVGSFALFISALGLVRTQSPIIGDLLWLKAMIPHQVKEPISKILKSKSLQRILLKPKKKKSNK